MIFLRAKIFSNLLIISSARKILLGQALSPLENGDKSLLVDLCDSCCHTGVFKPSLKQR